MLQLNENMLVKSVSLLKPKLSKLSNHSDTTCESLVLFQIFVGVRCSVTFQRPKRHFAIMGKAQYSKLHICHWGNNVTWRVMSDLTIGTFVWIQYDVLFTRTERGFRQRATGFVLHWYIECVTLTWLQCNKLVGMVTWN